MHSYQQVSALHKIHLYLLSNYKNKENISVPSNLFSLSPTPSLSLPLPLSLFLSFSLCVCIIHGQLSAPLAQLNSQAGSAPWVNMPTSASASASASPSTSSDVDSGSRNQSKSKPNQSSDKTSKTKQTHRERQREGECEREEDARLDEGRQPRLGLENGLRSVNLKEN